MSQVEEGEGEAVLHLLVVNSSLIEELKLAALRLEATIVVDIIPLALQIGFIDHISFSQTSHPNLIIFPIDIAQPKHIIHHNQILIKLANLFIPQLTKTSKSIMITSNTIRNLFNFIIDLSK